MKAELLDIYNDNFQKIGTKPRHEVHRDGDWHRVFHCWVIYRDKEGKDWVILQKRGANQDTYPNMLDISAAGHYGAGETVADGVRELHEELGLTDVQFTDLIPVGRRIGVAAEDGFIDRQVADVFLYLCDQPLEQYRYQTDEIAGLVALEVEQGISLCVGEVMSIDIPAVGYDKPIITISASEMIPTIDDYFYKVLILAKRCLDGEIHLRI